ncbi:hypothetical protein V493_07584, partial [Pseudogymnoascus sp. VKM F-4281 (FW-2241)]
MPLPPLKLPRIKQLPRRLPPPRQKDMVKEQRSRVRERNSRVHKERKDALLAGDGAAEIKDRHGCPGRDKGEEIPVVATADAVVEPHAVVVVRLDAVIADAAVVAAGRTPDMTGLAVFDGDLHGCAGGEVGFDDQPRG